MQSFFQQLASGLATGCAYALLALALVIIYRSTHHINFAQGEMATLSTYVSLTLIQAGFTFWESFGVTIICSFVLGAALQRWLIGRLHNSTPLTTVTALIGLVMVIHSLLGYFWGYDVRDFPSAFPSRFFFDGMISAHQVGTAVVTAVMLLCLSAFFRFTNIGLAIRASAQNPGSARLSGISTNSMAALGWGLAAAMGAVAGVLVAPQFYLDPHMMSGVLIYGFAAALLGGIQSVSGAVLGGLIIGVLENILGAYVVGTQLKLSVAFVFIVAVLLWRPQGLLGQVSAQRV